MYETTQLKTTWPVVTVKNNNNNQKKETEFAAHISSNEIMTAVLSSQKLALVSEDYHYYHISGGLSDAVGMHFFHVCCCPCLVNRSGDVCDCDS